MQLVSGFYHYCYYSYNYRSYRYHCHHFYHPVWATFSN